MTSLSLLSVLVLYPLTLLGDGCILIAIALAATVGGRPLLWGVSFAGFHALYGILGTLVASELTTYSELLGEVFILIGSLILLRHFMHHTMHHQAGGDCSCENHKPVAVSTRAIISTASAFSLHALASGAIVRGMAGDISTTTLIILIAALSALIGVLIGAIVFIGDLERLPILRALDSLPGVVAAALTALCTFATFHLLRELFPFSPLAIAGYTFIAGAIAVLTGLKVHQHRARSTQPTLTKIGTGRTKP